MITLTKTVVWLFSELVPPLFVHAKREEGAAR